MAMQCGAGVTPQAIDQRHTTVLVEFLEGVFRKAAQIVIGSNETFAPILRRFTNVTLLDSSTFILPDEMGGQFRGCGGNYGSGVAAIKLQTELDCAAARCLVCKSRKVAVPTVPRVDNMRGEAKAPCESLILDTSALLYSRKWRRKRSIFSRDCSTALA